MLSLRTHRLIEQYCNFFSALLVIVAHCSSLSLFPRDRRSAELQWRRPWATQLPGNGRGGWGGASSRTVAVVPRAAVSLSPSLSPSYTITYYNHYYLHIF